MIHPRSFLSIFFATQSFFKGRLLVLLFAMAVYGLPGAFGQSAPKVQLSINLQQPVTPYLPQLQQDLLGGDPGTMSGSLTSKIMVNVISTSNQQQRLKLIASLKCISTNGLDIRVDPGYQPAQPFVLAGFQSRMLSSQDLENTFANFSDNALLTTFSWDEFRQNGATYKLPEGTYRLCIRAYDYDQAGAYVEQCVTFTICYLISAPQFVMPFNTMAQFEPAFEDLSPLSSQIQFQWMPPASTCGLPVGGVTYDLEIRRVFAGQTLQDATNSIPVFQKQALYTNMFIFDTILNRDVLQDGKRYIVRIKANLPPLPNSAIEIENEGYGQLLAFTYHSGRAGEVADSIPETVIPPDSIPSGGGSLAGIDCPDIPAVADAPAFTGDLKSKTLTIGLFSLQVTEAMKNSDNTYKGAGTIDWKPFGVNTVKLNVTFSQISVNTNLVVTAGKVLTATDPTMSPKVVDLGSMESVAGYAGIPMDDINKIVSRVNDNAHILNQIRGVDPVSFPLGLQDKNISGGTTVSLAIMGITFSPDGTSMNLLFNLNISSAGGWLSLGGTNFCIEPNGFSFSKGMLYLPEDKELSFEGFKMKFKKSILADNQLADTNSTYLLWNEDGLEKVVVDADMELTEDGIIPVDTMGNHLPGPLTINAHFDFTEWNDWIASLRWSSAFEISGLPGFRIATDSGMYYDHSYLRNPPGIVFPEGYSEQGGVISNEFKGFYMRSLKMSLPPDFISSDVASFGFQHFIIDENGVSTRIEGRQLLSLEKGSLAGWGFSIDTLRIAIIKNAQTVDMGMEGSIRMPISETPLTYDCLLNTGLSKDTLAYHFWIQPQDDLKMEMWKATLTFADKTSTFSIRKSGAKTIAEAHMNGGIELNFETPVKAHIPVMGFQDFYVSSEDGIGIAAMKFGNGDFKNVKKTSSENSYDPGYQYLAGGPHAGPGTEEAPASGSNDNSGSISGFGFGLSDFELKMNSLTEYGLYFNVNLSLGAGGVGIAGMTKLGVVGALSNSKPEFKEIDIDSIVVRGDFGPIKINGLLAFFDHDPKFGNGIHGALEADFVVGKINAETYFGEMGGYDYFGVGGSLFMTNGVPLFAGLTMNGFGGGYYHNMELVDGLPDSTAIGNQASGTPVYLNVEPARDKSIFAANLILSYVNPDIVNMNIRAGFEINGNGGLSQMQLSGNGYIFSNPPANDAAMIQGVADITLGFQPVAEFTASIAVNAKLGPIVVNVPISMHAGGVKEEYWFYVGVPDQRVTAELLKIGIDSKGEKDALWALLTANAYLCTGNKLPAFPPLPDNVRSFLYGGGGSQVSGTAYNKSGEDSKLFDLISTGSGGGFMFGARVDVGAGLDFAIFYAEAGGTFGFDMALMQFPDPSAFQNCTGVDGDIGLGGWYAVGQLYAYLYMDIGVHLGVGDVSLIGLQLGAYLRGGGPNPAWGQGKVKIKASIIGFSVDDEFDFEFGSKCFPEYNPLEGVRLIADVSPKKIGVYDYPWVLYNVPVSSGRNYIDYIMPPNKDHEEFWTRTVFFKQKLDYFNRLNDNNSIAESLHPEILFSDDKMLTKFRTSDALWGGGKFEMKVSCEAYEMVNGVKKVLLTEDTVFRFATGPAPNYIDDNIVKYIYPIPGQQYVLKNEFNKKGIVAFVQWPSNKLQDVMHLLDETYDKIVHFIPYDGSLPLSGTFVPDYEHRKLNLSLPAGLQNQKAYKIVFVTAPKDAMDRYKAEEDSKLVYLADLVKGKSGDYSVQSAGIKTTAASSRGSANISGGRHVGKKSFNSSSKASSSLSNVYATNLAMVGKFNASASGGLQTGAMPGLNTDISGSRSVISSVDKNSIKQGIAFTIKKNKTYVEATTKFGMSIYELSFKTSRFNSFADKMNTYSTITATSSDDPVFSKAGIDFSLKNGMEAFDVFEIKGYERVLKNNETAIIPPLLQIDIPYNNTMVNNRYTSTDGNDGWAMENIYHASDFLKKSTQVDVIRFENPDIPNCFPIRSSFFSIPNSTDQRLYSRAFMAYDPKFVAPAATPTGNPTGNPTGTGGSGSYKPGYNPNGSSQSSSSINRQARPASYTTPVFHSQELKFTWLRDYVFYFDNELLVEGAHTFAIQRWAIQEKIKSYKLELDDPSETNIITMVLLDAYKKMLADNTDLIMSTSLTGRFAVVWAALAMGPDDHYEHYADIEALRQKLLQVSERNSPFPYFDNARNRDLVFKYLTPGNLTGGSVVTKEFDYKRK